MKKLTCSFLIVSMLSLYSGVYAKSINVNLPDKVNYNPAQYIEFDQSTTVYNTPAVNEQNHSQKIMNTGVVRVVEGTSLNVYMQEAIDTAYAEVGEQLSAMIKEDLVVNNSIVIPQGSFIKGKVIKARHAGNAGRNGKVSILFDKLVLPEGEAFNIKTEKIDFEVNNEGSISSSALTVAGAMLLGAAAGSVLLNNNYNFQSKEAKDYGKGAAAGAIITGVAILGWMILKKGKDAEIPQYTEVSIVLEDSLDLPVTTKY